jgi:hypothetical protein
VENLGGEVLAAADMSTSTANR